MYELIQISEHNYYIDCPAKIGLIRTGDTVIAVDSGSDKDAGKKLLRVVQANGWKLAAIFNTHSHADHIGGNKYLQDQTGCRIYAPGIECDFTNHPVLEPAALYGGCPPEGLRHKFLMAQPSCAEPLRAEALPEGMEIIPLPGHSFDMVGFRTDENTVYLADCLSSKETLEKYGVGYLWDVEAYLNTLEAVKNMRAERFVPAHAAVTDDIAPLAQYNIDAVNAIGDRIVGLCAEPVNAEALLKGLFDAYGMTMNLQQYALVGSTLRSYLSWLQRQGRVNFVIENNELLWQKS